MAMKKIRRTRVWPEMTQPTTVEGRLAIAVAYLENIGALLWSMPVLPVCPPVEEAYHAAYHALELIGDTHTLPIPGEPGY